MNKLESVALPEQQPQPLGVHVHVLDLAADAVHERVCDSMSVVHPLCLSTQQQHADLFSGTPAVHKVKLEERESKHRSTRTSSTTSTTMMRTTEVEGKPSPDMIFGRAMDTFVDVSIRNEELRLELAETKVSLS